MIFSNRKNRLVWTCLNIWYPKKSADLSWVCLWKWQTNLPFPDKHCVSIGWLLYHTLCVCVILHVYIQIMYIYIYCFFSKNVPWYPHINVDSPVDFSTISSWCSPCSAIFFWAVLERSLRRSHSTGSKLEPPPDIAFSRSISRSKSSKDVISRRPFFWGRSGTQKWTFLAPRIGASEKVAYVGWPVNWMLLSTSSYYY